MKNRFMKVILSILLVLMVTFSWVTDSIVLAEGPSDPAPEIQARGTVNGKKVLFDNTHGQTAGAADWVIDGGFSDFANALADNGYYVKELRKSTPIVLDDLTGYDVVVIGEANIPYKTTEQDAIIQYIQNGGSVFYIADHYNADRNKNRWDASEVFNGYRRGAWTDPTKGMTTEEASSDAMLGVQSADWLASNFGIRFRYNAIGDVTANNIVASEQAFGITNGVQTVAMHAGSTLAITDPNKAKGIVYLPTTTAAWSYAVDEGVYNGGSIAEGPYAAISKLGGGKAAFIGDSSPVEDATPKYKREENGSSKKTYDGFLEQDDATLLVNMVDWLATQESYSSLDQVSGLQLDQPTTLYDWELPTNSTEPQAEPWASPAEGYNWYDPTTFATGSYGVTDGSTGGGDTGGGTGEASGSSVFFSEYIEGSSYNKALEIYNGTGSTLDLSGYTIEQSNTSTVIQLNGTVAAGDVYVVAHTSAASTILAEADMTTSTLSYNGDDAITLKNNGTAIDVIGTAGVTYAKDTTLVRQETITTGYISYDETQWTTYAQDTSSDLGTHIVVASSDLFFSEYIEGSSYNKALEIYNGTGAPVDLSAYTIGQSNTSTVITLSGTVAAGDVYVVAHPSASASILAEADMTTSSLSYNGDDAITLKNNGTAIDVIGTAGTTFAKDTTLVRVNTVLNGTTTYNSSEWDSYSQDTFTYLGSHSLGGGSTNNPPTVINAVADQSATVGTDLLVGASTTFEDVDGDTLTLSAVSSNTTIATVSVSGTTVTVTPLVEGSATITVTADDGKGGTVDDNFVVTVSASSSTSNDLYFSEYIEGSSYNKALEIYNGTGSTIDLSTYTIAQSNTGSVITLSGTLAPGDVFVVAHSSASSTIRAVADMTTSSISYNGDDAVTLKNDGIAIDVIGTAGVSFGQDKTLVRKATVTDGTTTYDANEWDSYAKDTFTYLGSN